MDAETNIWIHSLFLAISGFYYPDTIRCFTFKRLSAAEALTRFLCIASHF